VLVHVGLHAHCRPAQPLYILQLLESFHGGGVLSPALAGPGALGLDGLGLLATHRKGRNSQGAAEKGEVGLPADLWGVKGCGGESRAASGAESFEVPVLAISVTNSGFSEHMLSMISSLRMALGVLVCIL
jgi:hypothetical protein